MKKRHVVELTEAERRAVRDALTLVLLLQWGKPLARRVQRVYRKFGPLARR